MGPWDNTALTNAVEGLLESVKNLKKLYRPVYGLMTFFFIFGIILTWMGLEVRESRAGRKDNREKHISEFLDLQKNIKAEIKDLEKGMDESFFDIGKDLGRNETYVIVITTQLANIEKKLEKIDARLRGEGK